MGKPAVTRAPLREAPNWALLALSGLGVVLAGYLAWTAFQGGSVRGCTAGSACDVVLTSRWATLLGLPTAFWGLLTYVALAATAFVRRSDRHWQLAWTIALFGLLYSAYLTTVSITILGAACPYCLTSLGIMTATFALVTYQRPVSLPAFTWGRWLARTLPAAAGVILVLHLNYTSGPGQGASPESTVALMLAQHLADSGAAFYGASWCPHCQEQKAMFGAAARRLPYIECSVGGPGTPQTPACQAARIETYPTWIIDGRRFEGVMTLGQLADAAGYPPSADAPSN